MELGKHGSNPAGRPTVSTGVCGGFTTCSGQTPERHGAGASLNRAAEDSSLLGCDTVAGRVATDVSKGLGAVIFMVVLPKTKTYSVYRRQKERRKREIKLHFRTDRQTDATYHRGPTSVYCSIVCP
jgi:hypothetical protein